MGNNRLTALCKSLIFLETTMIPEPEPWGDPMIHCSVFNKNHLHNNNILLIQFLLSIASHVFSYFNQFSISISINLFTFTFTSCKQT